MTWTQIKNFRNKKKIVILLFVFLMLGSFYYVLVSNVILQSLFHNKIWVHRVNSVEKLLELEDEFSGVELDLVFVDSLGIFDVNHPPAESIHLSLEKYLKSSTVKSLNYWLDFKNLNDNNAQLALDQLNKICTTIGISKTQLLVESSSVHLLPLFEKDGYQTSYYLPWPGLYQLKGDSLQWMLDEITQNLRKYGVDQISSNYHDYSLMKKYYPNKSKLLWLTANKKEYNSPIKEHLYLYQILEDATVKILLMKHKTKTAER